MRKLSLALALAVACFAAAAQIVPSSLENDISAGLFKNQFDKSFAATGDFGTVQQGFFFGGLGNPSQQAAWDTALGTSPLRFGLYLPKAFPVPLSIYKQISLAQFTGRVARADKTVNTTSAKNVVSSTTTTTVNWNQDVSVTDYAKAPLARSGSLGFQALTRLGPVAAGLVLNGSWDNSASDASGEEEYYKNITRTVNYDTAGAGVDPAPAVDYSIRTLFDNVNPAALPTAVGSAGANARVTSLGFSLPAAMATGSLRHELALDLTLTKSDDSAGYSIVESAHADTAALPANVTDQAVNIASVTTDTLIGLDYTLELPGLLGPGRENLMRAKLSASDTISGRSFSWDRTQKVYATPAVGAKNSASGTYRSRTIDYGATSDLTIGLDLSHDLYFPSGPVLFALRPTMGVSYRSNDNSGSAKPTKQVTVGPQTLTAAFVYDATTAYDTVTVDYAGDPGGIRTFSASARLPTALKFMPSSWKFGIIMGADPSFSFSATSTRTSGLTTTTTTVNATGATVNSTTINAVKADQTSTTAYTYALAENHYLGITVPFEGGLRLDARLNGSILNFESFTIQAFVPLE